MRVFFIMAAAFWLSSCDPVPMGIPKPGPNTQTYVPVYLPKDVAKQVSYQPAKPIIKSGKIYTIGNYLFQVEQDSGIHIIDYSDRLSPQKLGFIRSIYCSEMSVKGNYMYINNVNDLVVVDISDISQPKEVNRVINAFPNLHTDYPPFTNTFFECPDPSKGLVIGWKLEVRDYPKCYR